MEEEVVVVEEEVAEEVEVEVVEEGMHPNPNKLSPLAKMKG